MSNSNILCGNCKNRHESIQAVKDCHAGKLVQGYADNSALQDDADMAAMEAAGDKAEAEKVAAAKYGTAPVVPAGAVMAEIPAGNYVVAIDGVDKFYRVQYGKDGGKWAGFLFLSVQASDDYYPVKDKGAKANVLKAIRTQGVIECLARYGHALGKCGICSKTLTNPDSIAAGIGPICRAGL